MKLFPYAHATHPQWRMAAALVLAQLRAQMALPNHAASPGLGLLYITDHCVEHAQDILDHLSGELPEVVDWVGTVGVGICANNAEYFDEPALAVMLCDLPPQDYRVFSGVAPLASTQGADGFVSHTALLHADGDTPELMELVAELSERTASHYVFGGVGYGRAGSVQFARSSRGALAGRGQAGAAGVFHGGLSGVAFAAGVPLVSRVTQGVRALAPEHTVTQVDQHVILQLDGRPALDVLLEDIDTSLSDPPAAVQRLRQTLVGLRWPEPSVPGETPRARRPGQFGDDVLVRHLVGLDPARQGVAIAERVPEGSGLTFCERHVQAARADLRRICAEIREELEPEEMPLAVAQALAGGEAESQPHPARRIAGAVYVSCNGRGGAHFGGPSAELHIVRQALGDVPLVGFFAAGEIAHHHLYGYTGVLTVFVA
ncbi:MAG TPA: FIST C-terminal domain-containing protein [Macromonas sp.]|nr:FIST C-terminal domain-containing protein [Macromonas sp.]